LLVELEVEKIKVEEVALVVFVNPYPALRLGLLHL
tara:strand:- start:617 stop:721 length:105 start_codon:yes stop_codon:yes gene_type:complete